MNKYLLDCLNDYEREVADLKSFLVFTERHKGEEYQALFSKILKTRLKCLGILHQELNNLLK